MSESTEWMRVTQAAPLLGVHSKTLQELCASRQITSYRPNNRGPYLLNQQMIADYIRANTRNKR